MENNDTAREYIIRQVKQMGFTAEELGFKTSDSRILINSVRNFFQHISVNFHEEAREFIPEDYWVDLGIEPTRYRIATVVIERILRKKLKVAVPMDKPVDYAEDIVEDGIRYIEPNDVDDVEDWEITECYTSEEECLASYIKETYSEEDLYNYNDLEEED